MTRKKIVWNKTDDIQGAVENEPLANDGTFTAMLINVQCPSKNK